MIQLPRQTDPWNRRRGKSPVLSHILVRGGAMEPTYLLQNCRVQDRWRIETDLPAESQQTFRGSLQGAALQRTEDCLRQVPDLGSLGNDPVPSTSIAVATSYILLATRLRKRSP